MEHHTLIDTCVWIDLATDPYADEIVSGLEDLIATTHFRLAVPKVIREEFDRHKVECAKKLAKKLTGRVNETLRYVRDFGVASDKAVLVGGLEDFSKRIADVEIAANKIIAKIEKLLDHPETRILETTNDILVKAAGRGYLKKAPFLSNKNSVADAIILEVFLDFFQKHKQGKCTFSFVTHNKSDFADPADERRPHPELGEPFSSGAIRYSINLAEEINRLVTDLPPAPQRAKKLLSEEAVRHVATWPGIGVDLTICPNCKSETMEYIGGHPSRYGGWTVWQMCKKCRFQWDTGDFID